MDETKNIESTLLCFTIYTSRSFFNEKYQKLRQHYEIESVAFYHQKYTLFLKIKTKNKHKSHAHNRFVSVFYLKCS